MARSGSLRVRGHEPMGSYSGLETCPRRGMWRSEGDVPFEVVAVNEWICLRCDWTGGGVGAVCPRCGVALYRRASTGRARHGTGGPSTVPPVHDERGPSSTPTAVTGARWVAVLVLAGLVVTAGIGDWLVRRHAPDHAAALGGVSTGDQGTLVTDVTPVTDVRAWGESSVGHDTLRSSAEYIAEAAQICDSATVRLRSATAGLNSTDDREAWNTATIRYSERALAKLRALPLPKRQGQRTRFSEFHSLLRRQTDTLRRLAAAAAGGQTARAADLRVELVDLIHAADRREPLLRSCPVGIGAEHQEP